MKHKILLAEDDASVRKMISRVLESAGYLVIQAGTTEQAAAEFRAARPELVVWDLEMLSLGDPKALGVEGLSGKAVPVVALTAWPAAKGKTPPRGITALLEKPLDLHVLLKTIQELLQAHAAGHAGRLASAA